jgi:hypothetical protein
LRGISIVATSATPLLTSSTLFKGGEGGLRTSFAGDALKLSWDSFFTTTGGDFARPLLTLSNDERGDEEHGEGLLSTEEKGSRTRSSSGLPIGLIEAKVLDLR